MANKGIQIAIKQAGNQRALAAVLGVTQGAVNYWLHKGVSGERAIFIERLTGVDRALIRPDLFGDDENGKEEN